MNLDDDFATYDTRCACTHRYPHHTPDGCRHCPCSAFRAAAGPVVRERVGPPCPGCGAELLVTPAGQPCGRCRRQSPLSDAGPYAPLW